MSDARVTVAIPTLVADSTLLDCVTSIEQQTLEDWLVVVVDNSGRREARERLAGVADPRIHVLDNDRNLGFGASVNLAWRRFPAPFLATLNDDAAASPQWLERMVGALESRPDAGMCASEVCEYGTDQLDSAGMLICADGSSRQRGRGARADAFRHLEEALLPSGSAALYRRAMIDVVGGFDEDFFLYCEDTDLGLRARWAGWTCIYVPGARVGHRYSHTSGQASAVKAYYVERNRLFVLLKNFPAGLLWKAPLVSLARYVWHLAAMSRWRGTAGKYREQGGGIGELIRMVLRAHVAVLGHLPKLWIERQRIQRDAVIPAADFSRLLGRYSLKAREVAEMS